MVFLKKHQSEYQSKPLYIQGQTFTRSPSSYKPTTQIVWHAISSWQIEETWLWKMGKINTQQDNILLCFDLSSMARENRVLSIQYSIQNSFIKPPSIRKDEQGSHHHSQIFKLIYAKLFGASCLCELVKLSINVALAVQQPALCTAASSPEHSTAHSIRLAFDPKQQNPKYKWCVSMVALTFWQFK